MNSPELPTPGTHNYTITKFSRGFKYHGYNVHQAATLDSITDNSIVLLSNHGIFHSDKDNKWALQYLADKYPNCIYICWFYHEIYNDIPFKNFILTGEHFYKMPAIAQHKNRWNIQECIDNYVPLTFRASLYPEEVSQFPRTDTLNGCFIGTSYKRSWIEGLNNIVYITGNELSEQERVRLFLSSKIAFGFHHEDNVINNVIVERVFEGMAFGCVVISDQPVAAKITDNIVQIANTKEEFLDTYHKLLNDPEKMKDLQARGYKWIKQYGLYTHIAKNFIDKIHTLFPSFETI
jgi:spore maturation protein CgeB